MRCLTLIFFDPLEQFTVYYSCAFSSNLAITFLFILSLIAYLSISLNVNPIFEPANFAANIYALIVFFLYDLFMNNVTIKHFVIFPWILFLFVQLLLSNLLGLVPYTFTVTSTLLTTLHYSLSFFIGINLLGLLINDYKFFNLFIPLGTPVVIMPFLIIIEVVSYYARIMSLAIRLFANLMSGHTLIHILSGVIWAMLEGGWAMKVAAFIPWFVTFLITCLEVVIGFMQAYVFSILMVIYTNDAIALH